MLRILQWNINSLRVNRNLLDAALVEDQVSVCLLQETLTTKRTKVNIPGFTAHYLPAGDRGESRRCLILVRSTIPDEVIKLPVECGEGVETQRFRATRIQCIQKPQVLA